MGKVQPAAEGCGVREEHARHLFHVEGHVLAHHGRLVDGANVFRPHDRSRGADELFRHAGVADHGGRSIPEGDLSTAAHGCGDALGNGPDAVLQ